MVTVWIFEEDIREIGTFLMTEYGQDWLDLILIVITAVSCSPLVLPVWGYTLVGIGLGYGIFRLAVVMAIGSAMGSMITYGVGRYFSNLPWIKRKFPAMTKNKWTEGKSRLYVGLILGFGTASPIPCDVLYAACGVKRYPVALFFLLMVAGRLVRYLYMGIFFKYFYDTI
jgi:membrane protein YqaA with SNARE-associated domain